jgi:Mn-dependent DtxR family transcriptional regulator
MYLYDRTSAVKLGDYGEEVVEYRFRSHEYAMAFATINNVQAENAETLQSQLEHAISAIRL